MKKILLPIAILTLSTAAYATGGQEANNNIDTLYVRADVGFNHFQKIKDKNTNLKVNNKNLSIINADVGLGYQLAEKFRGEIVYSHYFDAELKKSGADTNWHDMAQTASDAYAQDDLYVAPNDIESRLSKNNDTTVTHKASIDALLLKGYADVATYERTTFFVGAGLGVARINETISQKTIIKGAGAVICNELEIPLVHDSSTKVKKKNNFAYSLSAGFAEELRPGIFVEGQYTFTDFGKTASHKIEGISGNFEMGKNHYLSHAIKFGLRFAI